jgi:two-component system, NtrC family, response regulator AtoC
MACETSSLAHGPNLAVPPDDVIFGSSTAGEAVRLSADMAATINVPVLLQGESGTGKEVLARYIHNRSSWGNGAFVKINCPAIPGALLESELFGYQKGAFTGAHVSKPGRVELAHGGTLFLDEVADLELGLQAKLLQLLQDGQFCRIGAQEERQVEVRFICATNRELEKEIKAGAFRQDLFYRVNVLAIELPPLRERLCDLPLLVNFLLQLHAKKFNRTVTPLSNRCLAFMKAFSWPGNIRELENVVKRYIIAGKEEAIIKPLENGHPDDFQVGKAADGIINIKEVVKQAAAEIERKIIVRTLEAQHWNRRATARALSLSYVALLYKLKRAGIPPRSPGRGPKNRSAAPSFSELSVPGMSGPDALSQLFDS